MKENYERKLGSRTESGVLGKFRRGIDKRLQAMTVAGFLVLGPAESYADQVKFSKSADSSAEFILEAGNTEEKLEEFKNKVKAEEPQFFEWMEKYKSNIIKEIDGLSDRVNNFDEALDQEAELELQRIAGEDVKKFFKTYIKKEHQILEKLKASGDFRKAQQMLKDKLDTILWNFAQLDNSLAVRNEMRKRLSDVKMELRYHPDFGASQAAVTEISVTPDQRIQAHILFSGKSFADENGNIDMNLYVNVFTHELFHSNHAGNNFQKKSIAGLRQVFIEGIAQDATFHTVDMLAHGEKGIRPEVGMNTYDERVVLISLVRGIIQSSSNPDLLAKWNVDMITDAEFLSSFKKILLEIGLDPAIADDLGSLSLPNTERYPATTKVLESVIARLQMSGYKLSPEFIKGILTSGRNLDDVQVREVEKNLNFHSLKSNISRRAKKIQEDK